MHRVRLVLVATLVIAGAALPASSAAAAARPAVTAFQDENSPGRVIDASRRAITTVGVDGVTLSESGASVAAPSAAADRQRTRAHQDGLRAELLVSNYSDAIGDFSEPVAHRMLAVLAHRVAVAHALVRQVRVGGFDGISVDLESLTRRDASGLVGFVRQLRANLPPAATLSISVMAGLSGAEYGAMGYSLRAIAQAVGRVMVMTYDQHGPWENTPGPIGALAWQQRAVRAILPYVARSKLDLGVGGYGYAWRPHSNDTLTDAQARRLAGSRARWNSTAGEWTARLPDGSTLWWSDARSWALRVALAQRLHLHGLAMWSLGQSDPLRLP